MLAHFSGVAPRRPPEPGSFVFRHPPVRSLFGNGTREISQVPVQPASHMPCSSTPAEPFTQTVTGVRYCPLNKNQEDPGENTSFEAHSHGFCDHCLRFALRSPSCARLASDFLSGFIGWGWLPTGLFKRISDAIVLPPLQVYPGAIPYMYSISLFVCFVSVFFHPRNP
jgi:hypothetical protein